MIPHNDENIISKSDLSELEIALSLGGSLILVVAVIFGVLGIFKVKNEYRMTAMYERQAVALERQAEAQEGVLLSLRDIHLDMEDIVASFRNRCSGPALMWAVDVRTGRPVQTYGFTCKF